MGDVVWVNCFIMPTGTLRSEQHYIVRRHDNTIVKGYTLRKNVVPTWLHRVSKKSKKKGTKEVNCIWGLIRAEVINKNTNTTLVSFPDDVVALVANKRVHTTLPEHVVNV